MKRQALSALLICALWSAAYCAEPAAKPATKATPKPVAAISGPTEAAPGDLVVLTAEPEAKGYRWALVPDTGKWIDVDGGRRIVFATGTPGTYFFVLATATSDTPTLYQHAVQIGTPAPQPDPDPKPEPEPTPDPTPKPTGLEALAYSEAAKIPAATRTASAAKIADAFDAIAARIAAKTLIDRKKIPTATAEAVTAAAGKHANAWDQALAKIEEYLDAESAAGRLTTLTEYRTAWNQIATGIRRAAK